ncbi:MAG TPA: hypothetical protein VGP36_17185 [Mycobacteriales bacterium]|jgi:hypothetical protein|nr:hypothetical protein [Mycobacteriales bacterium]
MTHHADPASVEPSPRSPHEIPPPAPAHPTRLPVWRHSATLEDGVRAVLAEVDRLREDTRQAEEQDRREPDEDRLRDRLEQSVDAARGVVGDVIEQVDQLEQYALSQRRWDLAVRLRAVAGARTVDVMATLRARGREPSQAQVEAAARVERALAGLNADADDLEHGFEDLKTGLRRLHRALRDVLGHRADRPLSLQHLRLLLGGTYRSLGTVAVGLLATLGLATEDGAASGDAAVAAATAVAASGERVVELVRLRMRAPSPEQRTQAAHDDLTYLVGDFAREAASGHADRDRLEDLYAAALPQSSHAARLALRLAWTAKQDYTVTARQVPVVLGEAMAAARADDPAALTEAAEKVREVSGSLTRYRIPEQVRRGTPGPR